MEKHATVTNYIQKHKLWTESLNMLRSMLTSCDFVETVKWGMPTYTVNGKNIAGLGAFKSYVGIWFFQGGLLKDKHNKLINAQEGKTEAMRQWRFRDIEDIEDNRALIINYLYETIQNQRNGKEIKPTKKPLLIPKELQQMLDANNQLRESFGQLNLTHKRDFSEYISSAKRAETKIKRLEKIIPMIADGVGLNDKYK